MPDSSSSDFGILTPWEFPIETIFACMIAPRYRNYMVISRLTQGKVNKEIAGMGVLR
jgi:hypothetical protein